MPIPDAEQAVIAAEKVRDYLPNLEHADGKSKAVSSLVLKSELADKMDQLHDAGATDILVLDISNSRM